MNNMFLSVNSIFKPEQLGALIAVGVILFLFIVANIAVFFVLRKRRERKLCTSQLQQKRDLLLKQLQNIVDDGELYEAAGAPFTGSSPAPEAEEDADTDIDEAGDDSEDEADQPEPTDAEKQNEAEILAVSDMSDYTRRKLGYVGDEFDLKRYYVHYTHGFVSKLAAADDDVKSRYLALMGELMLYKGVCVKSSFRQQRIYKGRKTLGIILFRGKTLCIALALDPKEYADTKYRGIDKSDKKRFEKTPMLYKLTSARRLELAKYLIVQLADKNTVVMDESPRTADIDLSPKTVDELFTAGHIKISVLGEAPDAERVPEPELTVEETLDGPALETEQPTAERDAEEEELAIDTPEGRIVLDRSFTARIIQGDDALKARYSELKNYILAYKGVRNRISWRRETFSIGRNTVATFSVRGKTLCLYLAADPAKFENTKYRVENLSDTTSRRKTPMLFRVKSDRRTAYAKQLIDMVMAERGAARAERRPMDYTTPYKSTDTLVKRGLIRITQSTGANPFGGNKN